jgi:hypothetical protein
MLTKEESPSLSESLFSLPECPSDNLCRPPTFETPSSSSSDSSESGPMTFGLTRLRAVVERGGRPVALLGDGRLSFSLVEPLSSSTTITGLLLSLFSVGGELLSRTRRVPCRLRMRSARLNTGLSASLSAAVEGGNEVGSGRALRRRTRCRRSSSGDSASLLTMRRGV